MRDDLDTLLDAILGDDPKQALAAYRDLADRQLPWLEQRVVALARRDGLNWAVIGRLLGRTRQTVRERFGTIVARPAPGRSESSYSRMVREHEEAFLRLNNPRPEPDDDPVGW